MSDDKTRDDEPNQKPKTVKRPSKPKAEWLVPNGIAWLDEDGAQIRARAGSKLEAGIIPDDLIDEYAGRGDIIKLTRTGSN